MADESAQNSQDQEKDAPQTQEAAQPEAADTPRQETKPAGQEPKKQTPKEKKVVYLATGRRKASIARVRLMEGTGKILVNDRLMHQYFPVPTYQRDILAPLRSTKCMGRYDVTASVYGGGMTGQTGAIVLGIARAILKAEPRQKETLQKGGWLTRDSRVIERKKYGRRKARRSTQYSKR